MKLTIKELNEKLQLINQISVQENDKLTYAIKKLQSNAKKATEPVRTDVQDKVTDLQLGLAATDDKGIIIEKDNQYQYSKEDKIKLVQGIRDLNKVFDSTMIEVEPFTVDIKAAPRILDLGEFLIDEIGSILFSTRSLTKSPESDGPPGQTYPPPPLTTP